MANRAYLYFTDDVSALTFGDHYEKRDGTERNYLDSRHYFPLAWFLFFEPDSVQLVKHPPLKWSDLYLVRPWESAKADFLRRVPLLLGWFRDEFSRADVDVFLAWVESLIEAPQERFLVVDPSELEINEASAPVFRALLAELDDAAIQSQRKFEVLDRYAAVESIFNLDRRAEQRRDRVFGFFYGPVIEGYFQHRVDWPDEAA